MKKISMWISEEDDTRLRAIAETVRNNAHRKNDVLKATKADIIRYAISKVCLSHFSSVHVNGEEIERAIVKYTISPEKPEFTEGPEAETR